MKNPESLEIKDKIVKMIKSCETHKQLHVAKNYHLLYLKFHYTPKEFLTQVESLFQEAYNRILKKELKEKVCMKSTYPCIRKN